jgi:hypothetical protein
MKAKQQPDGIRTAALPKPVDTSSGVLSIVVPYTTPELTRAALKHSAVFGSELEAQIRLIEVHVVPFACPLDRPAVSSQHLERRLRGLAEESPRLVRVELIYTRDQTQTLRKILKPHSLVVIAANRWRWPSAERKLARFLRRAGHDVMLLTVR